MSVLTKRIEAKGECGLLAPIEIMAKKANMQNMMVTQPNSIWN